MSNQAMNHAVEKGKMGGTLEALGRSIARWTCKSERIETAIPGLILAQRVGPTKPMSGMYEPSICLAAQGSKRVVLGDDTYDYDARS